MLKSGTVVVLLLVAASYGLNLPPYIKPCARSSANFNDCAFEHAKETFPQFAKGDKKYRIPIMDPLEIKEISVSDGPSQTGLNLTMRDIKMHGLKDADIKKVEYDFDKQSVFIDTNVPRLMIVGKYEIAGRILVLPISGKGDINITLISNRLTYSYEYTIKEKDGVRFHKTKNPKAVVEPTNVRYDFTNLFNGDKVLGKQVIDFLNENWSDIYKTLSPAIADAIAQFIGAIIDNIADVLPFDDLYPETVP